MPFCQAPRWACAAALALLAFAAPVLGQNWPVKPVHILVPFAPGGSADTLGRIVAAKMTETFGQTFVVDNRGGAGGVIGSDQVAKSAPDGYSLVVSGIASHAIGPAMQSKPSYDPVKDFTHIALFGGPPLVFAANASLPVKELKDFIALARSKQGQFSYGSPGVGTHGHLFGELLQQLTGIRMQHIPYKGAHLALEDLIGGRLQAISTTLTSAGTQIKARKALGLAVSAEARVPDFPEVPTFRELGYPNLTAITWFSLSGPAGMPSEIVTRLNGEVRRILKLPDVSQRLHAEGMVLGDLDPKAFTDFVIEENRRWGAVVRASGAHSD